MKLFKCPAHVRAGKIIEIVPGKTPGSSVIRVDGPVPSLSEWTCEAPWMERQRPKVGDYLVAHETGFMSVWPGSLLALGYAEVKDAPAPRVWLEGDVLNADHMFGGPRISKKLTEEQLADYHRLNLPAELSVPK